MKKNVKPLVTLLLTGSMLLGTVSIAGAAVNNTQAFKPNQQMHVTQPAPQNIRQNKPVQYINAGISRSEVSIILNSLVKDGTITRTQARTILKEIASDSSITWNHLNSLLKSFVSNGILTSDQMAAIMDSMPANTAEIQLPDRNDKPFPGDKIQQPNRNNKPANGDKVQLPDKNNHPMNGDKTKLPEINKDNQPANNPKA
jgi:hypothetical protein